MILHLLKSSPSPLALQTLNAPSPSAAPPVIVLLAPGSIALPSSQHSVYRLTENPVSQEQDELTYEQLVEMIFKADRVITW